MSPERYDAYCAFVEKELAKPLPELMRSAKASANSPLSPLGDTIRIYLFFRFLGTVNAPIVMYAVPGTELPELPELPELGTRYLKSAAVNGLARRRSRVSSKKTFRHVPEEYDLLLVTDQLDLPAETIALLYRWRWTVELFFRWFKCVLGFQHLIFESRRGVEIMVYSALIASLLISLWTGRKPTKRTLEMVQLYFQGWAELDELEAHIASLKRDAD